MVSALAQPKTCRPPAISNDVISADTVARLEGAGHNAPLSEAKQVTEWLSFLMRELSML